MRIIIKILFKLISLGLIVVFTMGVGLALYASTLLPNLPTVEEIRHIPLNIPLRIYSSDQKLIGEYGNERRIPVTLDQAPPLLIDAILVTEDDRFYHHTGVDFPGLVRAAISNFMSRSKGQGASTITMQVARNFFLNPEKTYTRKLKEILLAFNLERALTKDEILELYLNKIFLGHRSYGFAAAAQVYYGVELENLSVPEIAMLAGLPKAPSRDNPISNPDHAKERRAYVLKRLHELGKIDDLSLEIASKAPITARRHSANVDFQAPYIAEMARQFLFERFGQEVYEKGLNVTVTVNSEYQKKADQSLRKGLLDYDLRHGYKGPIGEIDLSTHSTDQTNQEILDQLDQYPPSKEIIPAVVTSTETNQFNALTQQGSSVTISKENFLWAKQYIGPNHVGPEPSAANQLVSVGDVIYVRNLGEDQWMLSQLPEVSGALVSLDPHSGAILALTGGFDYYLSKFNRATQAERQPGSNIKPFIYSAAFDHGFTPGSLVSAAPIVIENELEGIWRPQNYSKKFFGPTRLRRALSLSLNLVSVRLLRSIGLDTTIAHLGKFGFDPEHLPRNLSLALGSTTITPLELASSFAVVANGGTFTAPYLIEKIEDPEGNPVELPESPCKDCDLDQGDQGEDSTFLSEDETVPTSADQQNLQGSDEVVLSISETDKALPSGISPQNAFLTQSIMRQVIRSGTGQRALALNRSDLAGKTGTTNDFRDAWFSGFSPDVVTTVFVGFDEPSHLGTRESGASAALPIWVDFMGRVLQDFPEKTQSIPNNITTRFINKNSGLVTSLDDPDGYTEYYLVGSEPNNLVDNSSVEKNSDDEESVTESLF